MAGQVGPGNTQFIPNDDGSISVRRWNDPSWTTRFAEAPNLDGKFAPSLISHLLARAYEMGRDDQRQIIRNAIGTSS